MAFKDIFKDDVKDELILHGLSALANVQHLKTSVVLSTFKHKTQLPL